MGLNTITDKAMYLSSLFNDVIGRPSLSPNTVKVYTNAGRKFQGFVHEEAGILPEKQRVGLLNLDVCWQYKEALQEKYKPQTVSINLRFLKIATDRGMKIGAIQGLGLTDLKLPQDEREPYKALKEAEVTRALIASTQTGFRNDLIFRVMLGTGLRIGEVVALDEASYKNGMFLNVGGKGEKKRDVTIPRELCAKLDTYLGWKKAQNQNREPLFVSTRDTRFNVRTIYGIVSNILIAANVPRDRCNPHSLRHTFALRLLARASLKYGTAKALSIVQQALGHAYRITTEGYLIEDNQTVGELIL